MPTDLLLPQGTDLDPADLARRAEDLGYDGLWIGELWGESAVVRLAEIATVTDDVALGTAILNVFSRSPAVLAMTAATLDRLSEGRFRLGVGTSTRTAVENLHGMDWDDPNPVRRAHEAVEIVRALLDDGGQVDYAGEVFEVRDVPPLSADVPIYGAALGRANRRMVARLCDGWIPHNVPLSRSPNSISAFLYGYE
ncbi:MAG: LLM class flavin-dependent oxidoreductase, partial [Haloarculaceae archaeon]